jgi:hypothetical protein
VEPILYTYATEEQRAILREQYDVSSFFIKTIRLERIFADKIFAAEFYYVRQMYFDVAKHIYDVSVMMELPQIQTLMSDRDAFLQMIGYKRREEMRRTGSDLWDRKCSSFSLFSGMADNAALQDAYQEMQKNYVFSLKDVLLFDYVLKQWRQLKAVLMEME